MPKIIKTTYYPDDLVTKGYLKEELEKFAEEINQKFSEELFEQQTLIAQSINELGDRCVTKEDWLGDMDQIMGTLKAIQGDLAASLYRQQEHSEVFENTEERLDIIENELGIKTAVVA